MTVVLILAIVGLIAMNAFFVAAEYALVRSRPDRVEAAAERDEKGAVLFRSQIESIDDYIAACQVGEASILILRILHGAQLWPTDFQA